jgi:Tfp pilus assembly protein PilF
MNQLPLLLKRAKKNLAQQPGSANAAFNYAYYLAKDTQFEAAINMYRRALKLNVSAPEEAYLNIANIYMDHLHANEKARKYLQKALARNPRYAGAYHNLGNLSEQLGDRDEAARYFEKCLEIDPGNDSALARLADTHRFADDDDSLLARLVASAASSKDSDLHFALGRAFDQLADYEMAWQYLSKANYLDRKVFPPYRQEQTETAFHRIISQCDSEWIAQYPGISAEPVFICGMFRTGSTLLEQVLASHPNFTAGGESEFFPRLVARDFRDYPQGLDRITPKKLHRWEKEYTRQSRQLSGGTGRLTDKRPDNFLYIGLIKAVFPSAKFVVTERDWRDVATSIFATRLGPGQNYATSLENIHHYIRLQKDLVDHWESILGPDLIRVRYEDLVGQPRETVSDLLQRLGENWDERCLSFHKLENTVKTASVWQVREPFHSRSIGRWKNYQQQFEDAFSTGAL